MKIVNTSASKYEEKLKELKKLSFWLEGLETLENSNKKYIKEYEKILKEKENRKEDFKKLEFTNKTLNIDFLNSSRDALEKLILQNIKSQKDLQNDFEKLNNKLTIKQTELKSYDLEINSVSTYEKTINEKYIEMTIDCNVLLEDINSLKTSLKLLEQQLETINKRLLVDNVFLKQLETEITNSLKENEITSKKYFLKEILPIERREVLSKECNKIKNEYLQISTLKIDSAKRLKEQKELNLTNRKIEDINSELAEIQNSIEELNKQNNSEL